MSIVSPTLLLSSLDLLLEVGSILKFQDSVLDAVLSLRTFRLLALLALGRADVLDASRTETCELHCQDLSEGPVNLILLSSLKVQVSIEGRSLQSADHALENAEPTVARVERLQPQTTLPVMIEHINALCSIEVVFD